MVSLKVGNTAVEDRILLPKPIHLLLTSVFCGPTKRLSTRTDLPRLSDSCGLTGFSGGYIFRYQVWKVQQEVESFVDIHIY